MYENGWKRSAISAMLSSSNEDDNFNAGKGIHRRTVIMREISVEMKELFINVQSMPSHCSKRNTGVEQWKNQGSYHGELICNGREGCDEVEMFFAGNMGSDSSYDGNNERKLLVGYMGISERKLFVVLGFSYHWLIVQFLHCHTHRLLRMLRGRIGGGAIIPDMGCER